MIEGWLTCCRLSQSSCEMVTLSGLSSSLSVAFRSSWMEMDLGMPRYSGSGAQGIVGERSPGGTSSALSILLQGTTTVYYYRILHVHVAVHDVFVMVLLAREESYIMYWICTGYNSLQ